MRRLRLILVVVGILLGPFGAGSRSAGWIATAATHSSFVQQDRQTASGPQLLVAPTTVTPGAVLTVAGTGYAPRELLVVTLGGIALATTPAPLAANAQGNFIVTASVPATVISGPVPLVVTGARSRTRTRTVIVVRRPTLATWYFAGLDAGHGSHSAIAVLNPDNDAARVTLHVAHTDSPARERTLVVGGHSRATLDLAADAGGRGAVLFVRLSADRRVFAAATVARANAAATSVPGVSTPRRLWYLAEGSVDAATHESVRLYNPAPRSVRVLVRLLGQQGPARLVSIALGGDRGYALDVNAYVRRDAVGVVVQATGPVVVQRVSTVGARATGGTASTGVPAPAATWTFPVGVAPAGARTWYAVVNPDPHNPAAVTATFYDAAGRTVGRATIIAAPQHRATLLAPPSRRPVAVVRLTSNIPVVAERTVALTPHTGGTQGYTVAPTPPTSVAVLPDGNTGPGYREDIVLYNATGQPAGVAMEFYTARGTAVPHNLRLPAHARVVVAINRVAGLPAGAHGTVISSTGASLFVEQRIVGPVGPLPRPVRPARPRTGRPTAPRCSLLLPRGAFPTHMTAWVSTVTTPNAGAVVSGLQLVHYRWGYVIVTPNRYRSVADAGRHYQQAVQLLHGDRQVATPSIGQQVVIWVTGDAVTHYTITTVLLRAGATVTEINVGAGGAVVGVAIDLAHAAAAYACR